MSNSNTNLQTQSSNALHNAIMEAKQRIVTNVSFGYFTSMKSESRDTLTQTNSEPSTIDFQNPPYTNQWAEKTVSIAGRLVLKATTKKDMRTKRMFTRHTRSTMPKLSDQIITHKIDTISTPQFDAVRMHVKCGNH
ncbi:hypothetical protein Tco_0368427 [Tanacetum coccineum]